MDGPHLPQQNLELYRLSRSQGGKLRSGDRNQQLSQFAPRRIGGIRGKVSEVTNGSRNDNPRSHAGPSYANADRDLEGCGWRQRVADLGGTAGGECDCAGDGEGVNAST